MARYGLWSGIGKLIAGLTLALLPVMASAEGDAELGRKLYWEGIGADGRSVQGKTQGDVPISGAQFSCVNCHRPSGFGTSEGGNYVPPIIGPVLYNKRTANRNRMFKELYQEVQPPGFWARVRQPRLRPAYDTELLGRALRDGVDAAGRPFDPIMPRYELSDQDVANLDAFLKTLSVKIDPGVEEKDIHLATIIGPGADPAEKKALLDTLNLFFTWMNKDTEGDTRNPTFSPRYRSEFIHAYRYWRLHVWELKGEPETWREQLEAYYEAQPVFASVSGLVPGPWDEIGKFCDDKRLPCILPNTELPVPGEGRYGYSVYFNRGVVLEAEALAMYLGDLETAPARIVQLHGTGPRGTRPAAAFADALPNAVEGAELTTYAYDGREGLKDALAEHGGTGMLVIWPDDPVAAAEVIAETGAAADTIVLPSATQPRAVELFTPELIKKTKIVWPYDRPDHYHPRKFRIRAWMHTRRLDVTHPRLQLQTYYALTMMQYGLLHAITDFHRDYLLEIIEHEAENELNPGTHPELALGPGQRFASKGAYIAELAPEERVGYRVISDWIVP